MNKAIRTFVLIAVMLCAASVTVNAQGKLSEELKKAVESATNSVANSISDAMSKAASKAISKITSSSESSSKTAETPEPVKPAVTRKLSAASSGKFNAHDPFDKNNFVTAGTPWDETPYEPVELPLGITVNIPDPLPDINEVSMVSYNAAVALAFNGMRMIYGETTEKNAKEFSDMWAPLYDCPSQEIIDYLNKLNPLISQFLVTRQQLIESMASYEELLYDLAEASEEGDKEIFQEILAQVAFYAKSVQVLNATLSEIANRIGALGNPPNPFEAKAAARRQYNRIFPKKEKQVYLGESWMGTRPDLDHNAPGLPSLTEPLFRYLFKAEVKGVGERYFVIQLVEHGMPTEADLKEDPNALSNIKVVQYDCDNLDGKKPKFTLDGAFRTYFPKPPVLAITTMTTTLLTEYEMSYVTDEDRKTPSVAQAKQEYHDACALYGARISLAGFFFKTGILWSQADKWSEYEFVDEWAIPDECLSDFAEAVGKQFEIDIAEHEKKQKKAEKQRRDAAAAAAAMPPTPEQLRQQEIRDSLAREEQSRQESIQEREAIIEGIRHRYSQVQNELNSTSDPARKSELRYQLTHLSASIDEERDYINGLKTGEFHHTYNAADAYAMERTIINTNIECERNKKAKKSGASLYKLVSMLPEEEQADAKKRVDKLLFEDGALSKDDTESMAKLGKAIYSKVHGAELKEQAEIQDMQAWNDLKEAGVNATIVACGSLTAGLASSALAATYGAEAAVTIWGAKAIGAAYSGVTGYLAGGPLRGVSGAAGAIHPAAGVVGSFIEGFYDDDAKGLALSDRWDYALNKATTDFIIGAAFDAGTFIAVKGITAVAPKTKMNLFPPKKPKLDMLKTQRQRLEAKDAVNSFGKMYKDHQQLVKSGAPQAQIDASQKQLDQMAASLNSDYHAKWQLKYKADPEVRASFDKTLQKNYETQMIPKMTKKLQDMGYDMSDIEFKQFRNSSSSGSSSMDLDLAPVSISKNKGKEPVFYNMKTKKEVPAREFMADAQKAMNQSWKEDFHLSGKLSEMNLTTSAHPEAFSNPELLKQDIDFSKVSSKDVASIGQVLEVKVNTIENNQMMTRTTKMQAKCREASKEINNMLMPKLKSDLSQYAPGSKEYKAIQGDIAYWQRMEQKISAIGKGTSDPVELHKLNIEVESYTGGKDVTQVINDLIHTFNPSFKVN